MKIQMYTWYWLGGSLADPSRMFHILHDVPLDHDKISCMNIKYSSSSLFTYLFYLLRNFLTSNAQVKSCPLKKKKKDKKRKIVTSDIF